MKKITIRAKYKNWVPGMEDDMSKDGTYKVREIHESNTGKKRVRLWGFASSLNIDEVVLLINNEPVEWV